MRDFMAITKAQADENRARMLMALRDDRRDRHSGTAGGRQSAAGLPAEVVSIRRFW